MSANQNNFVITVTTLVFIALLCFLIGKSIADLPLLPIVLLTALIMLFFSFTRPDIAIMALIMSMLLSPEFAVASFSDQRNVVIRIDDILIVVFFFAWLARVTVIRNQHLLTPTPINRYILFYCATFIIPTLKAMITGEVSLLGGTFYVLKYLEYFLVFFIAAAFLKDKKQMMMFLKIFFITFAIVNIYAFLQVGHEGRVSAPFEGEGEPNTLGGYQILLLAVIIGLLTHARLGNWRLPLIGIALFTFIPFAHTLSRSSYMSIVPMYFTLIFFNKFKSRSILIGLLFIAVIALIFYFPENIRERIAYTFTPEELEDIPPVQVAGVYLDPSASTRIHDWIRLFNAWKKHPFMGYGVTGMGFVDSQFIRVLVETGLIGFTAFLLLLGNIFKHSLRIYRTAKDGVYKGLALGFLAGHIGMIFHAMTANTFILIRIMEPYWFLAAIVMMIPALEKREADSAENTPRENGDYPRNSTFLLNYGKTH